MGGGTRQSRTQPPARAVPTSLKAGVGVLWEGDLSGRVDTSDRQEQGGAMQGCLP